MSPANRSRLPQTRAKTSGPSPAVADALTKSQSKSWESAPPSARLSEDYEPHIGARVVHKVNGAGEDPIICNLEQGEHAVCRCCQNALHTFKACRSVDTLDVWWRKVSGGDLRSCLVAGVLVIFTEGKANEFQLNRYISACRSSHSRGSGSKAWRHIDHMVVLPSSGGQTSTLLMKALVEQLVDRTAAEWKQNAVVLCRRPGYITDRLCVQQSGKTITYPVIYPEMLCDHRLEDFQAQAHVQTHHTCANPEPRPERIDSWFRRQSCFPCLCLPDIYYAVGPARRRLGRVATTAVRQNTSASAASDCRGSSTQRSEVAAVPAGFALGDELDQNRRDDRTHGRHDGGTSHGNVGVRVANARKDYVVDGKGAPANDETKALSKNRSVLFNGNAAGITHNPAPSSTSATDSIAATASASVAVAEPRKASLATPVPSAPPVAASSSTAGPKEFSMSMGDDSDVECADPEPVITIPSEDVALNQEREAFREEIIALKAEIARLQAATARNSLPEEGTHTMREGNDIATKQALTSVKECTHTMAEQNETPAKSSSTPEKHETHKMRGQVDIAANPSSTRKEAPVESKTEGANTIRSRLYSSLRASMLAGVQQEAATNLCSTPETEDAHAMREQVEVVTKSSSSLEKEEATRSKPVCHLVEPDFEEEITALKAEIARLTQQSDDREQKEAELTALRAQVSRLTQENKEIQREERAVHQVAEEVEDSAGKRETQSTSPPSDERERRDAELAALKAEVLRLTQENKVLCSSQNTVASGPPRKDNENETETKTRDEEVDEVKGEGENSVGPLHGNGENQSPPAPENGKGPPSPEKGTGKGPSPPTPEKGGKGKGPSAPSAGKGSLPPPPLGKGKDVQEGKGKTPPPPKGKGKGPPPAHGGPGKAASKGGGFERVQSKTKCLGWKKLARWEEGTFWSCAANEDNDSIDILPIKLEELFSNQPAQGKKPRVTRTRSSSAMVKSGNTTLLTPPRSMCISIHLHALRHLSPQDIRDAICALDETVLTPDVVGMLLTIDGKTQQPVVLPTVEEVAAARAHVASGLSLQVLDLASQFICKVYDIPHLHDRLVLQHFRGCFATRVSEMKDQLATLTEAMMEVRNNEDFASILKLVLKIGNVLNEGTQRGYAWGFHMESLAALSQVKQSDTGVAEEGDDGAEPPQKKQLLSLLDHLVRFIAEKRPALLDMPEKMQVVAAGERVDLKEVDVEMRQLRKELGRVASTTGAVGADDCNDQGPDAFAKIGPFLVAQAEEQLKQLSDAITAAQKIYTEVSQFFGESRKEVTANIWLGYVQRFLVEFQAAVVAHRARIEREQAIEKRKQALSKPRRTVSGQSIRSGGSEGDTKAHSESPWLRSRSLSEPNSPLKGTESANSSRHPYLECHKQREPKDSGADDTDSVQLADSVTSDVSPVMRSSSCPDSAVCHRSPKKAHFAGTEATKSSSASDLDIAGASSTVSSDPQSTAAAAETTPPVSWWRKYRFFKNES